ncbi:hypothetical protein QBC45DRAFT_298995, partial [Copromyces sp. CBS 386.78]
NQSAYSLQQDSHLGIDHPSSVPISCDRALSFLPKPHHLTWLYPPLSCLGYCVWKPHNHHPLPDCHHALWPNSPTSTTDTFSTKHLRLFSAGKENTAPPLF